MSKVDVLPPTPAPDREKSAEAVSPEVIAKVARKKVNPLNRIAQEPRAGFYVFISNLEGGPEEPWLLQAECVTRRWMDAAWDELVAMPQGKDFGALWEGLDVDSWLRPLLPRYQALFWDVFSWFTGRAVDRGQGFIEASMLEMVVPRDSPLRAGLVEGWWYEVELADAEGAVGRYDPALVDEGKYSHRCLHTTLAAEASGDERPEVRWLHTFRKLPDRNAPRISRGAISVMHYPHGDPGTWGPADGEDDRLGGEGPPPGSMAAAAAAAAAAASVPAPRQRRPFRPAIEAWLRSRLAGAESWLHERARAMLASAQAWCDETAAGLWLEPALAGGPSIAPPRLAAPAPEPSAYIGYPQNGDAGAAMGNLVQEANPMIVAGGARPFVGVIGMGQGNCNVLYDNRGQAIVYYDLGAPTPANAGTTPNPFPRPCFCDAPLIVLSHWDYDHYAMARFHGEVLGLRWLAPRQLVGSVALAVMASIVVLGGQIYIWNASSPSHMRFPWGFVERADGAENLRNSSGLVAYVCVKDNGGVNADIVWPAAATPNAQPAIFLCTPGLLVPNMGRMGGGAPPPEAVAAAQAVVAARLLPGNDTAREATAAAIERFGGVMAAGGLLPTRAAIIGAAASEAARIGGATRETIAVAAAAALAGHAAGMTAAQVAAAATAAVGALPLLVLLAAKPAAAAAAGLATGIVPLAGQQIFGLLAVEIARFAPGLTAHDAAQAAHTASGVLVGGGALVAAERAGIGVVEAAILAATAASAHPGFEAREAARAVGVPPGNVALALQADLQPLLAGAPPFDPLERYVHLTADVNFAEMPTIKVNPPPVIVGLLATHHGSNRMDGVMLDEYNMPWAPRSPAALAAATAQTARSAAATEATLAVAAAVAFEPGVTATGATRIEIACVAEAAVWAAQLGGNQDVVAIAAGATLDAMAPIAVARGGLTDGQAIAAAHEIAAAAVAAEAQAAGQRPIAVMLTSVGLVSVHGTVTGALNVPNAATVVARVACAITPGNTANQLAITANGVAGATPVALIEAVVRATQEVRRFATAATMQNAPALLLPGADPSPVASLGAFHAERDAAHHAAKAAVMLLAPSTDGDPTTLALASAVGAEAHVIAAAPADDLIALASFTAAEGRRIGHPETVIAAAVACLEVFRDLAVAATAATATAGSLTGASITVAARDRRVAAQQALAAAAAAVAAAPGLGAKPARILTVRNTPAVYAAVLAVVAPPRAPELLATADAAFGAAPFDVIAVLASSAAEAIRAGATQVQLRAAAVAAVALVIGGTVVPGTVAAHGNVTGTGVPPLAAQRIAQMAVNIVVNGDHATVPSVAVAAAATERNAKNRNWRRTRVVACFAVKDLLVRAVEAIAVAAVEVAQYPTGGTVAHRAADVRTGVATVAMVTALPAALIEAVLTGSPPADAGVGLLLKARGAAVALGVEPPVAYAATWAGPIEALPDGFVPLVEASAGNAITVTLGPIAEGVGTALLNLGAGAQGAADAGNVTPGDRVAFSYGIDAATFEHCHTAGAFEVGHPDPLALYKYGSHGWTTRMNTSAIAHQGLQPDLVGRRGHIALGWEVIGGGFPYEGPIRPGPFTPGLIVIVGCGVCNLAAGGVAQFIC